MKISQLAALVIGTTKEINETYAIWLDILLVIQFVNQETFCKKQFYLLLFVGTMQMFDLYIIYIYFGAEVSHASLKYAGQENSAW